MPYPDGLQTVQVTAGPYYAGGATVAGRLWITPAAAAVHVPSGAVLLAAPIVVEFGAEQGTATVPASDGAGLTTADGQPVGYVLSWDLPEQVRPRPRRVLLPAAAPTVDADVLTAAPSSPAPLPLVPVAKGDPGDPGPAGAPGPAGPPGAGVLVLAVGAPVPDGTPAGTVVFRS